MDCIRTNTVPIYGNGMITATENEQRHRNSDDLISSPSRMPEMSQKMPMQVHHPHLQLDEMHNEQSHFSSHQYDDHDHDQRFFHNDSGEEPSRIDFDQNTAIKHKSRKGLIVNLGICNRKREREEDMELQGEESPRSKQSRLSSLIDICGYHGDEWFVRKSPLREDASDESKEKAKAFFIRCTKAMAELIGGKTGSDWLLEDLASRVYPHRASRCVKHCKAKKVMLEVAYYGSPVDQKLAKVMLCCAFDSRNCQEMPLHLSDKVVYPAKANEKTYTRYRKEFKEKVLNGKQLQLMKEHVSHVPRDRVQSAIVWVMSTCVLKSDAKRKSRVVLGTMLKDIPIFLTNLSKAKAFEKYKETCVTSGITGLGYPSFREVWSVFTVRRKERPTKRSDSVHPGNMKPMYNYQTVNSINGQVVGYIPISHGNENQLTGMVGGSLVEGHNPLVQNREPPM